MSKPNQDNLIERCNPHPTDNMGVEINNKEWHVDWLTITVWGQQVAHAFDMFFNEKFRQMIDQGHGGRFYMRTYRTDLDIVVREEPVNGGDPRGTIEIPGKACQFLGYYGLRDFINFLKDNYRKVRYTRIDLAFDYCNFSVADVEACLLDDNLRSYFKRDKIKIYNNPFEKSETGEIGCHGLTIGGRSSTRYMRIYDKHGFTRLELEFKAEKADQVGNDIFGCGEVEQALNLAIGHVCDYVEFFTEWWEIFRGSFKRLYSKLPSSIKELSVEGIKNWFESQIAAAFYVIGSLEGARYLDCLYVKGKEKYERSRYQGLIELINLQEDKVCVG